MIKRIELVNFMSHEHSVLELAEGLTVLAGANNCGKSAVVAALRLVCYNGRSTHVVRHGARECSVTVETSDGHTIRWSRKRSGSPRYEIDGDVFDRLGQGGVPPRVHELLRMPVIEADQREYDVHFGVQQSPRFLVDAPPSAAAEFFASSSDAIRLVEMQTVHKNNVVDRTRERSRLVEQETRTAALLERVSALDPLMEDLEQADQAASALQEAESSLAELDSATATIRRLEILGKNASRQCGILEALASPPQPAETVSMQQLGQLWKLAAQEFDQSEAQTTALGPLRLPPEFEETGPLQALVERIAWQSSRLEADGKRALTASMLVAPEPEDPLVDSLEHWIRAQQLQVTEADFCARKAREAGQALERVRVSISDWIRENPQCPACGAAMNEHEILERAGHGHE